jgi:hypothetical protein
MIKKLMTTYILENVDISWHGFSADQLEFEVAEKRTQ